MFGDKSGLLKDERIILKDDLCAKSIKKEKKKG